MTENKKEVPLHQSRLDLPDKEASQKVLAKKRKQMSADMAVCFGSVEGCRVLRYIIDICGFQKEKIGGNPQIGMDIHAGLLYNCAREQVFIELSELLPAYILKDVLFGKSEDLEE
jgi:hypothetical protein